MEQPLDPPGIPLKVAQAPETKRKWQTQAHQRAILLLPTTKYALEREKGGDGENHGNTGAQRR